MWLRVRKKQNLININCMTDTTGEDGLMENLMGRVFFISANLIKLSIMKGRLMDRLVVLENLMLIKGSGFMKAEFTKVRPMVGVK